MTRRGVAIGLLLVACAVISTQQIASAQTATSVHQATIEDIRRSVLQVLGVPDKAVEVTASHNTITILHINSELNRAGHNERDAEASRITPIVLKAIAGKAEFKRIHTIKVEYADRADTGAAKVVDTIYFRKAPGGGTFLLHTT